MKKTFLVFIIILFSSTAALAFEVIYPEAVYSDKSIKAIYEKANINKPVFVMDHLGSETGGTKFICNILNNQLSQEEIAKFERTKEMKVTKMRNPNINSSEVIYSDKFVKSIYEKTNINKPAFVMDHLGSQAGSTKFMNRILNTHFSPEEVSKFEHEKK